MADFFSFWGDQFLRYVPMVTWIGLVLALGFTIFAYGKRSTAAMLLGCVAFVYGITPYIPNFIS